MPAKIYHLSNGTPVAIDVMQHTEVASVGMYFNIGARFETKATNGSAHFLEHMFFKGTRKRSEDQLHDETADDGISVSAYTSHEETGYQMTGLGSKVSHMIDLLGDMVTQSTLPPRKLELERGTILQEIAQDGDLLEDGVTSMARRAAYPHQAYGADILGPRKNVIGMSRKMLMDFMKEHYHAGNLVISVAGNVDPQAVLNDLEKAVGHLPARGKSIAQPAVYKGGYRHQNCLASQFHLKLAFNACASSSPDYWGTELLSTIMGLGMSSRLFKQIRTKQGIVYDVSSVFQASKDTGMFEIYAATDHKDVKKLIPVLCEEINKVRDHGVTERELARAKNQQLVSLAEQAETTESRMQTMADQMTTFGRLQTTEEIGAQINSVTVETVNALARKIFSGKPTLASAGSYRRVASYENVVQLLNPQ